MRNKILRRFLMTLIVLIGVSIIAFALVRLAPGDLARTLLPDTATDEQIEALREKMGMNESYLVQYFKYMAGVLKGDLGYSYRYKMDCNILILYRLKNTAILAAVAVVFALIIAIPLGMIGGIKKGSLADTGAVCFALLGQAMSPVWLCLLLILIFAVKLHWLPSQGMGDFKHIIMPAFCLGFSFASLVTRMLRSQMIEVLQEDYITATRARGISRFKVYTKYAFKNSILPVLTVTGNQLGKILAGSMVIESIFGWPGLGELTITAINSRDFQLVQSILLVCAVIMVLCNLLVDILYTLVDKRISFN